MLHVLTIMADGKGNTFEAVRTQLISTTRRKAPPSREALWTVARDALSDLQRMGFLKVGPLPRKRSEVNRLRETPCEITAHGADLARLSQIRRGKAYDQLLVAWMNHHPYFRAFTARLLPAVMYVPDITSAKQLGKDLPLPPDAKDLAKRINDSCLSRLAGVGFSAEKTAAFASTVENKVSLLGHSLANRDAKKLVDTIQDNVVLPAILESENLRFDSVTLQHIIGCSRDFLSAGVTVCHPSFVGRVFFSTCDFSPDINAKPNATVSEVIHHGRLFASDRFVASLASAYRQLKGSSSTYVDVYPLRALVSVNLRIQPSIFAMCLERVIDGSMRADFSVYTELPFTPPPQGESYLEVKGRRIGLLRLSFAEGG